MFNLNDPFKIINEKFRNIKCGNLNNYLHDNEHVVDFFNFDKCKSLIKRINYDFKYDFLTDNENFIKFKFCFINSNKWIPYTLTNGPKGIIIIPNFLTKNYCKELFNNLLYQIPLKNHSLLKSNINLPISQSNIHDSNIRWLTFGYHYNWTNKIYNKNDYNEFPQILYDLLSCLKYVLNLHLNLEGGIVNYYTCKSKLNPHSDCRELNKKSPLLSISLGEPAIFLLGKNNRFDEPVTPIVLRDGDLIIMSDESRLSYHSIIKIICNDRNCKKKYLKRININVRQVY